MLLKRSEEFACAVRYGERFKRWFGYGLGRSMCATTFLIVSSFQRGFGLSIQLYYGLPARLGVMTLGHDTLRNTLNGTAVCGEGACVRARVG